MDEETIDNLARRFENNIFLGIAPGAEECGLFGVSGDENINPSKYPEMVRRDVILGLYQAIILQRRASHAELVGMLMDDKIDEFIHGKFHEEPTSYYTIFFRSKTVVGPVLTNDDDDEYVSAVRRKFYNGKK